MRRLVPTLLLACAGLVFGIESAFAENGPNPCLDPDVARAARTGDDEEGIGGSGLVPLPAGYVGSAGRVATLGGVGDTGLWSDDEGGVGGTGLRSEDLGGVGGTGLRSEDLGGVGGTGLVAANEGVGGTGLRSEDLGGAGVAGDGDDDGIGGTGIRGTITRFGSICVNGLRVHYDERVPVVFDREPAAPGHLRIGQVVWVEARSEGGRLVADRIEVESALRGRVRSVDPTAGALDVDGLPVDVSDGALVLDGAGLEALGIDDPVEIFGLPDQSGRLVASRIDLLDALPEPARPERIPDRLRRAPHLRSLSLEGFVPSEAVQGLIEIDGLDVDLGPLAAAARALVPGARVWVRGRLEDGKTLKAEELSVRSTRRGWRPQARLRQQRIGAIAPLAARFGRPSREATTLAERGSFLRSARRALRKIFSDGAGGASGASNLPSAGAAATRATRLVGAIERSEGARRRENVRRLARFMRRLVRDDRVGEILRDPQMRRRFRRTEAGRQILSYPRVRRALDLERGRRADRRGGVSVGAGSGGRIEKVDKPKRPRREKRPERPKRPRRKRR